MNIIEQLDNKLRKAYMKGPVSFIVMNNATSKMLMEEMMKIICNPFMTLSRYEDLEILISESLNNYEFRFG
jgi:hypothetical protein